MKKCFLNKILTILFLVGTSLSCTSDLNFDQAVDLVLEPVYEGNLSYFDVPATAFVSSTGAEYQWAYDDQNFDVFRDNYINSYLQRADFYFEITNTIQRAYSLNIVLHDANDNILTTINFQIPAYSGTVNTITQTEIFQNARLELLKKTTKMRFFMAMQPGPALDQNSTGNIVLRSSATVYMKMR
jgi:hypothetical protein